jgi:hypothetical protein
MKTTLNIVLKSMAIGLAATKLTYAATQDGGHSSSLADWMPLILLTAAIYAWHRYKQKKDSNPSAQLNSQEVGATAGASSSPRPKSRKQFIVIGLVIFVVLFVVGLRNNGGKTSNPAPNAPSEFHSMFDETPFNLSASKLPGDYWGHSCLGVSDALSSRMQSLKKDEFESTEAYNARVASLPPVSFGKGLTSNDVLAFEGSSVDLSSSYNADSQTLFAVDSLVYSGDEWKSQRSRVKMAARIQEESGTYVGTNGFGATKDISKAVYKICGLDFRSDQFNSLPTKFEIAMPPEEAKKHKANLAVLYIGKVSIDQPSVTMYYFNQKPSFNSPKEMEESGWIFNFQPSEIWLIDKKTGEVLAKNHVEQSNPVKEVRR